MPRGGALKVVEVALRDESYEVRKRQFVDWATIKIGAVSESCLVKTALLKKDIARAEQFVKKTLQMNPGEITERRRRRTARKQLFIPRWKQELRVLESSQGARAVMESYGQMFDDIHAIPRLSWFGVNDDDLFVETNFLYGKLRNAPKTWHKVGNFTITIPFSRPFEMVWRNHFQAYFEKGIGVWSAPQILNTKKGCFGSEASELIKKAERKSDIRTIIEFAVRSCETQGFSNHADERLKEWPVVPDSEVPEWYLEHFGKTGESLD